jgi:hypothetical protein
LCFSCCLCHTGGNTVEKGSERGSERGSENKYCMEIGQSMDIQENINNDNINLNNKNDVKENKIISYDDPICGRLVPLPDGKILYIYVYIYIHVRI